MSRLTPFSRFLITLLIVGGVFFGIKKFMPQLSDKFGSKSTEQTASQPSGDGEDHSATLPSNNSSASNSSSGSTSGSSSSSAGSSATAPVRRSFDYTPTEPVGGKLKGVVELGASGFNSFVVRIDPKKNWKLEKADYGASLVYEKMTTDDDVKMGLKNYIAKMLDFGVSGNNIHFVISSGAQKVPLTTKIIEYLKQMGYVVNTVSAEQEGKLGLKCVLPKEYENDAFVTDIGSGNTKITYFEGSAMKSIEGSGAKYFQLGQTDDAVYTEIKQKAGKVPNQKRKVCFIIGGAPFQMAKAVRQGKERFTVLGAPDSYKMDDAKAKAGINIYKAIADGTDCQQFVFDWDANFTIGFLLGLP
ncbi:MAG: hypothetical protein U5L45_04820 [Saprospiraceae bacterium]|nr:hypothetical protein [Saprospiraceae bacterium]